ncbi:hypothetical protein Mgra_00009639, partial [Meloidogyne graminicola]
LLFLIKLIIIVEGRQDNGFILLTDKVNTQHKLHYVNMDQCMLQPEQEEIGSYGLIFEKPNGYLCDEILICYPSQLVRNSSNGMISAILYRLRKARKTNVTIQCENKREEFCNKLENKDECRAGQPGSIVWHGIKIKTEYNEYKLEGII